MNHKDQDTNETESKKNIGSNKSLWEAEVYGGPWDPHLQIQPVLCSKRRQQDENWELPEVQAGFNIHWFIEKATEFQKNICFIDYAKASGCVIHNKLENS